MRFKKRKYWTKDELKQFLKLWESKTTEDLSREFGVKGSTISAIAGTFRKEGMKLTFKRKVGSVNHLIKELVKEIKK